MTDRRLAEARHLLGAGRPAEAAPVFAAATRDAATAGCHGAWVGLGEALAATLRHAEAIPAFRQALALAPGEAGLRVNLARSLFALGHVSDAVHETERAIREGGAEVRAVALLNQAVMAPGDAGLGNAEILRVRRRWAQAEAAGVAPLDARPRRGPKLRIAYTGGFFDRPNWMKMYMGVINAHDRGRFEVNLIADGGLPSAAAGYRDHDEDRIWEVTGLPNAGLARHLAEAGIDVLVDLNGFSHAERLTLLLHRAAPVQVAWNGMFATTGLPGLDAIVGDAEAIPPEEDRFCTEPVRRVARTYLPFRTFYPTPPVAPPPCLRTGHVTFGSLASAYKLTSPTLNLWAAALRACPGSRLLLRNRALDDSGNRADLVARLAAFGVAADRLDLRGGASHQAFLATYGEIDVSLDTLPYNGGTTTAEALWQGVPVLTTMGDRWAGRTSRSILVAAGFAGDVCADEAALVARAAAMARDPDGLAARRAAQRERVAASPAADPEALCRELEALYLELAGRAAART